MPKSGIWIWFVLIAGFFGFYLLFLKVNRFIKILAIGSFINCFFSSAPYFSFIAYISLVIACYFYIACTKIKDWNKVFKIFQTVVIFNVLFILMQAFGLDQLLEPGVTDIAQVGIIAQKMQCGSQSIILSALLLPLSTLNFIIPILIGIYANAQWGIFCAASGIATLLFFKKKAKLAIIIGTIVFALFLGLALHNGKLNNLNKRGRYDVWKKTVALSLQKPITGWGIGSYQHLFHPLSGMKGKPYKNAHNDYVQVLFETGFPGLFFMIFTSLWLLYSAYKAKAYFCLAGIVMIIANMQVHFPMRILQIFPIMILFLAYCEYKIKENKNVRII